MWRGSGPTARWPYGRRAGGGRGGGRGGRAAGSYFCTQKKSMTVIFVNTRQKCANVAKKSYLPAFLLYDDECSIDSRKMISSIFYIFILCVGIRVDRDNLLVCSPRVRRGQCTWFR